MKTNLLAAATPWITTAALRAGAELPDYVMDRLQIGRRPALALLRRLEAAQWLQRAGTRRKPCWQPGPLRQVVQRYALAGLQEDLPWSRDFAPFFTPLFTLKPELARIAQHAFTELLNNAIEHSGGAEVTVSMRQTALQLQLLVSDDGCGLFQRLLDAHELADPRLAMLELGKGKLSSRPDRHSGRGLFFCSRLADVLDLHANETAFQHRAWSAGGWHPGRPLARQGTSVYLAVALDTPRTLDAVLRRHSADGRGYGFDRTVVPLKLLTDGDGDGDGAAVHLGSRAQARRAALRLQAFRHAELDFSGIAEVGHSFVDELFRVFARDWPQLELQPTGMAPRVAAMVDSVRSSDS
ncbi:MAG: ATP-binding protein [Rubrivivax sp.]